ncbi:MAG: peptide chain release factor 2 [Paenibacillus macerans]|uniref:peptide chain release factor 2 n=1 Tax=Paenibacillus TaxID=44249 RepID=UPI001BCC7380|nr:peptide chain release factor 2 [Paenibacillus macerans]MBS5910755.1 peptide chain release factor 2 [Paenibacillus macerans]MDU7475863.1 peptide chain release factor 2 [Paenibacillus macerans]MEC0139306.1 peptide chain release factor 2 [Paenibacillus macerans]MEC0328225.1 peptide chain release factor 2 [Paenibacillus macerans]UMV50713.1 peptide chain release factor 2 [Paenibacillus macerans]
MIEANVKHDMREIAKKLSNLRGSLDLDLKQEMIANYEEKMAAPDFWDDNEKAQAIIAEMNAVKSSVDQYLALQGEYDDIETMAELAEEEGDESLAAEISESVTAMARKLEDFELQLLLNQPYDKMNAILELHPGAGGTESQDWGQMLLRMYTRWAEKRGFKVETLDYLPGDEAGIKSVTLLIKGYNAYGYLKAEKGVHRLVRISPFDASGRRHTSFVSCDVVPEISEDVEVEVRPEDLKIDTYRASGAGGQHINTTDSAVRITHIPTGIVVTCQNERSQIKNRERAMTMLRSKLYERKLEEQQKELDEIRGEQSDIAWGSQIRSYVFHPYSMVKDHRTSVETGNIGAVMDGDLDAFIDGYLRSQIRSEA